MKLTPGKHHEFPVDFFRHKDHMIDVISNGRSQVIDIGPGGDAT